MVTMQQTITKQQQQQRKQARREEWEAAEIERIPKGHSGNCEQAMKVKCECECGGCFHGIKSMQKMDAFFADQQKEVPVCQPLA